jgi:hypothetical protein
MKFVSTRGARHGGHRAGVTAQKKWIDDANALARRDGAELEAPEEGKKKGRRALGGEGQ